MFNGDRLRVARQRRGHTKKNLAKLLGVTPRTITGWEADEYPPEDSARLDRIAEELRFPVSFFSLDDTAKTLSDAVSFRSLSKKRAADRDAAIAMCDISRDIVEWLDDRFDLPNPSIPDFRNEDPSMAAWLVRQEWGLGNRPIKNCTHLMEAKGVRVFSLAENCEDIDACSFWSDAVPFILLNTNFSAERLRFDIAHELGHLVLHKHAAPSGREAENEANAFASAFLMPEDSIKANRAKYWSIPELIQRKKIWKVSVSALAYRLHKMGLISDWHFKSLNIEMRRREYKTKEPEPIPMEQSSIIEFVLSEMRGKGMSLRFVANQICIPEDELRGFFYGLAKVSLDGMLKDSERPDKSANHLRVVK